MKIMLMSQKPLGNTVYMYATITESRNEQLNVWHIH